MRRRPTSAAQLEESGRWNRCQNLADFTIPASVRPRQMEKRPAAHSGRRMAAERTLHTKASFQFSWCNFPSFRSRFWVPPLRLLSVRITVSSGRTMAIRFFLSLSLSPRSRILSPLLSLHPSPLKADPSERPSVVCTASATGCCCCHSRYPLAILLRVAINNFSGSGSDGQAGNRRTVLYS